MASRPTLHKHSTQIAQTSRSPASLTAKPDIRPWPELESNGQNDVHSATAGRRDVGRRPHRRHVALQRVHELVLAAEFSTCKDSGRRVEKMHAMDAEA